MPIKLPGDSDVNYTITARDVSAAAINSALAGTSRLERGIENLQTRMKAQFATIQKHWLGMTAAIYAAVRSVQKAWDLMGAAADYNERIAALDALGQQYGMTGQQIVSAMQDASRGLLSMAEAADMAASSLNLSLSPEQMIEFTRVAETMTDIIGGTIPEAFNRMVVAAASGRTQTLAQMGIIVDLTGAYERYAAEHGRTVKSLSEVEKQQIRLNTILEAAKGKIEAMGPPVDTFRDKMDRLTATIKDLRLWMGQVLMRAALAASGAFQLMASGVTYLARELNRLHEIWLKVRLFTDRNILSPEAKKQLEEDIKDVQNRMATMSGWAEEHAKKASEAFEAAFASVEDFAKATSTKWEGPQPLPTENLITGGQEGLDIMKAEQEAQLLMMQTQMASMRDLRDGELTLDQALLQSQYDIAAMEQKRRETEMDALVNSTEFKQKLMQNEHAMALANINEYTEAVINSEERTKEMRIQAAQDAASALKNISTALLAFAGEKNESMFKMAQAFAIAEAIVNTYAGATRAYKDLPYPYSIFAAATIIAAGLAQVAQIASARPGMATASAGSGGAAPTYSANPTTGFPESGEVKKSTSVVINVYGNIVDQDKFAREMVPAIKKATEDGAH